jgi:hypothetical protein
MLVNIPNWLHHIILMFLTLVLRHRGFYLVLQDIEVLPLKSLLMNGTYSPLRRPFAYTESNRGLMALCFLGLTRMHYPNRQKQVHLRYWLLMGWKLCFQRNDEYTPTPVISHAILTYNRGRKTGLADGIVITPSHNPPHDGDLNITLLMGALRI